MAFSRFRNSKDSFRIVGEVALLALVLCIGLSSMASAAEQQTVRSFNIPAQPLKTSLEQFAEQADVQMLYALDVVEGLQSQPVVGDYTPEQALGIMLAGTGLIMERTDSNTMAVRKPTNVGAAAGAAAAGGAASQKPVKVPEILVKDIRERDNDTKSFVAEEASTATRTDTPIRDVPQSIQVITRKVIEEQRAFRLIEATQNVSGINTGGGTGPTGVFDNFIIRGFQANTNNFFRNGLWDGVAQQVGPDTYNIQRLEVLKGPASVLYGQGDPGGIINIVTRKPLPDPRYSGNVTLGNFNFYRSEIDATGPLNAGKTFLYRLSVAGQKANSFIDFVNRDMMAIAPSVTWLMSARTTLTVEADYLRRWYNNIPSFAVPGQGSVLPNINGELPRSMYTGLPNFDKNDRRSYRISYDLTHQFNDRWSIRNAYRYAILEYDAFNAAPNNLLADQRTLTRLWTNNESSVTRRHQQSMITNLVGHFRLLEMDHTLLTGVELRQDQNNPQILTNRPVPSLDLFAPNYALVPGAPTGTSFSGSDTKLAGFYLQDQIALLPNLKFMGGFRFDYVHQTITSGTTEATGVERDSDNTAVSPRLGLVYQPIEEVSLYTSWMRGFLPNAPTVFNPNGTLFEPERSTQYEIGIKNFFLNNRVSTTLAWFHLTRENLLTQDPVIPFFQVQTGKQRSQGIELDVTASLIAGWNVIASYAYTDAEVTADNNPALLNKRLGNVPYNKATIWSTYHFQEGPLKGFGLGGGIYGYTSRNASIFGPGQTEIPGYVRVDTAFYYDRELPQGNWLRAKEVNVALNFRNLLDQRYVDSAQNPLTRFWFGEPRTVLATVGLRF
ncbi:Ferrichrome-iron receptor [Nitrospira sp. KM1]|uniref:TonB-dependent siderophore receptor n=1 Tax=Nitrospira sp. KM1 TaxID=1936990 RepID=UPI0013A7773A|nr:TonB-dependent receptor [Nitrospira sp. KM1]BCA56617.1 Ferrichrome-iron receptor [Nitrospira sp. KM1]